MPGRVRQPDRRRRGAQGADRHLPAAYEPPVSAAGVLAFYERVRRTDRRDRRRRGDLHTAHTRTGHTHVRRRRPRTGRSGDAGVRAVARGVGPVPMHTRARPRGRPPVRRRQLQFDRVHPSRWFSGIRLARMRTAAILPVKRFSLAKQRLGESVAEPLRPIWRGRWWGTCSWRSPIESDRAHGRRYERAAGGRRRRLHGSTVVADTAEQGQSAAVSIGLERARERGPRARAVHSRRLSHTRPA